MKLLAISGSLRRNSYNTAVLKALQQLATGDIEIKLGDITQLPLFNPDLENSEITALTQLKADIADASGLIIASPEYAHGISGPMKNALDWLVSSTEFPYIPIMLINTSPRASHALAALKEVLLTMSATLIDSASVSVPLLSSGLGHSAILHNQTLSRTLQNSLLEFHHQIEQQSV